jgi:hypothetical protein
MAKIRRGGSRSRWGEGGGGLVAHLELDFNGWNGAVRPWRAASAAPVGTDHRAASAGARLACERKWAARAAHGGARGGGGGLFGLAVGLEPKLAAAARSWRRRMARSAWVVLRAAGGATAALIEELSDSGQGKTEGAAQAEASTAAGRQAGATWRRAPASRCGAGSAESRGALVCVLASGGCAA